jgi:hypothetical protein
MVHTSGNKAYPFQNPWYCPTERSAPSCPSTRPQPPSTRCCHRCSLHAAATASSAVISNNLGPNAVGMARAVRKLTGIEGGVTCLGPRVEAPPNVAASAVSSTSVISSSSASWRRRAMVSKPERVVTKARRSRDPCPKR